MSSKGLSTIAKSFSNLLLLLNHVVVGVKPGRVEGLMEDNYICKKR